MEKKEQCILSVRDLGIEFRSEGGWRRVVNGVDFDLYKGRTLGIVGESGSGKSVSSMALMGLLPKPASHIASGSAIFYGDGKPVDLLTLDEKAMRHYRGNHLSMVFQEPMTSLNPVKKCGAQVVEMLRQHEKVSDKEARSRVLDLFNEVLLPRPEKIFDSYPHEISGGQKQRVMIAMALVCNPSIVIADEPTTALDVTVQKTILQLLRSLQQKHDIAIIFISHDLGVIAQIADDLAVMYHGEIVEHGEAAEVLHSPQHPYTRGLLACRPPLDRRPLRLPTVSDFLEGKEASADEAPAFEPSDDVPLLSVSHWTVTYPIKKSLFGKVKQELRAVDDVSFDIYRGETLGLVGESGCGKTTLGRSLLQLIEHSSGEVTYKGERLDRLSPSKMRHLRTRLQIIFQDPYSSLNPRLTVGEAIAEPLKVHHRSLTATQRREKVLNIMEQVGLTPECYNRYPHEFSGGQRQRVCIARALIMEPELVICDESVSALDVSVQAQVLNLLNDLKRRYGFTYLFITHDLSVVKFISDRIMVMQKGKMVELAPADDIYDHPQQEYTRKLIDAIPRV